MNAAQQERLAVALRVLADCTKRSLVVASPSGVRVYGRDLDRIELRWLVLGLDMATVADLAVSGGSEVEDKEVSGFLYGQWLVRVILPQHRLADLKGVVRMPASVSS